VSGLAFDVLGGPLVAVCGLTGGAGTSTIALALAHQAAAESAVPVLLTEADPVHAGLAALAGASSPHPLVELARRAADDTTPAHTFLELRPGLRLVAAHPQQTIVDTDALGALLEEARAAHGLVIVDHATTWTATNPVLAGATHILWCLPATPAGVARAQSAMAGDALPRAGSAVEVLVATALVQRPRASVRALRRLAAQRCERLVLIPHSEPAANGRPTDDDAIAHALAGFAPSLRSRR
jgi:Mrp family chromosome partitioning ATPase